LAQVHFERRHEYAESAVAAQHAAKNQDERPADNGRWLER